MDSIKKRRILMSVLGVLTGAVSVAIFKMAAFGVDPFQSFMSGADKLIPIGFGTLYVIVNAVLLLFSLVFDRHYIGIATFINLFLLGYVTEFSYKLFRSLNQCYKFAVVVHQDDLMDKLYDIKKEKQRYLDYVYNLCTDCENFVKQYESIEIIDLNNIL